MALGGCASAPPYVGQGPHPQITRGHSIPPVDFVGTALSWLTLSNIILWNWNFNDHDITAETEEILVGYLSYRDHPVFEKTAFRLNQYSPIKDLSALVKNSDVGFLYRIFPGLYVTLVYDVLLPGRLFPWGDYYNPYTNTVHLYSDDPAIALHEAGHAWDSSTFERMRGTYAMTRIIPFFDLSQEWAASREAIDYFVMTEQHDLEIEAYKTLWPAFGTYAGAYLPVPLGSIAGAGFGHLTGRMQARERERIYKSIEPQD